MKYWLPALLVIVSLGCDSKPLSPTTPTPTDKKTAPFGGPIGSPGSVGVPSVTCVGLPPVTAASVIVTSVGTDFFIGNVTFRLIDGSSVGGPTVTFPSADLTRQFGNTLVPIGTSLPLNFVLGTGCLPVQGVAVTVVDGTGVSYVMNASAVTGR